ncbi:ExbD/TolR family protein [Serratia microhaemolytica]|uniref:ExbD/TolR family protein n=1 Tax=Serratia microhaemolytica TaxID=2675110 RepID=UPI0013922165|nr:biopolymer transporter ExbD [Serratia microhaemolytica]
MNIRYRTSSLKSPMLDLTALLDIIFIVMVFLLLSTNIRLQMLPVSIPEATATSQLTTSPSAVVTVSIPADGDLWGLQDHLFEHWHSFSAALLDAIQSPTRSAIVVASDNTAHVEKLIKLLAFFQQHHIEATQIIMREGTK